MVVHDDWLLFRLSWVVVRSFSIYWCIFENVNKQGTVFSIINDDSHLDRNTGAWGHKSDETYHTDKQSLGMEV